ncbi:MAG TPA: hypothetical protein VMK12_11225 [Anaeromyxobacteraceae bacterium]|nr:hypothetical protein [Anaeromyxobacteraceae bacterium]
MSVTILLFALDNLRQRYGALAPQGKDPRHDTSPFRAFRTVLLEALAERAHDEAEASMWWEGGYNEYALAVAVEPTGAVSDLEGAASRACPLDGVRVGPIRRDRYSMGLIAPGRWQVAYEEGAAFEAPFGAPTGHFGAPGIRRVP